MSTNHEAPHRADSSIPLLPYLSCAQISSSGPYSRPPSTYVPLSA